MSFCPPGDIAIFPHSSQEYRQAKRQQSNKPRECEQNLYAHRDCLEEDQQICDRRNKQQPYTRDKSQIQEANNPSQPGTIAL